MKLTSSHGCSWFTYIAAILPAFPSYPTSAGPSVGAVERPPCVSMVVKSWRRRSYARADVRCMHDRRDMRERCAVVQKLICWYRRSVGA